jgi:hypothetical protein
VIARSQFKDTSASPYIIALASCDIAFSVTVLLAWTRNVNPDYDIYAMEGFCQGMTYIGTLCIFASSWIIFSLLLDRHLYVFTSRLTQKYWCTKLKAKFISVSIYAVGVVVYLNVSLLYTVEYIPWADKMQCVEIDQYKVALDMFSKVEMAINVGLPYLLLTVLTVTTIVRKCTTSLPETEPDIYCSEINGRHVNNSYMNRPTGNRCPSNLLNMTLALSIYFLLFSIPAFVANVVVKALSHPAYFYYITLEMLLTQQFLQLMFYYRFAFTAVVYIVSDPSFRQELARLQVSLFQCIVRNHKTTKTNCTETEMSTSDRLLENSAKSNV